ncbi:SGNH/GDSL hydrolase family protein [Nocardia jiangsuensis]|uniref:SGNH/GDSL hydrolase family protein n=1 Tax=Nocardia jiangsuensis TaxID=1691563 RepID=A0ABV8E2P2_9NOCA
MQTFTEADDPALLTVQTAAALLADAPWRRFAVVGDSIAQGIGDSTPGYRDAGWADRVADALRRVRPELAYLNTGRKGATSAEVLAEQLGAALAFEPDLVHIVCGGNDLFVPEPDLPATHANLDALFAAFAGRGTRISTFTLTDVWDREQMRAMRGMRERMSALNDVIRAVAARYDAVLLELWPHPIRLRPDLMSADLIHFSMGGQAALASAVVQRLAQELEAVPR